MSETSASTPFSRPVTVNEMQRVMRELELIPKSTGWMLITPDGRVFKGEPQELLQVLMPHHPLLKGFMP